MLAIFTTMSCKKDDNNVTFTPPRDVTEVRDENDATIVTYLKKNSYKFENNEVIFQAITENTANKASLYEKVQTLEIDVYDTNNKKVRHKLYYLPVQEGNGKQSTIADSVYVAYKGMSLDGKVFDQSVGYTISNWLDLMGDRTRNNQGVVVGFREGVKMLKDSGSDILSNNDGTLNVPTDGGVGVFFIPSGLGYFNNPVGNISAYSPLVFVVKLIKTKNADHDRDGIPTIQEIKVGDYGAVTYPDCDNDTYPDYIDADKCN